MDLKKILKIRKKMKTIPSLQYMTHGLVEEQETLGKTKRTKKMKTDDSYYRRLYGR